MVLLIDQRSKRNEVERAIWGKKNCARISEQRADRTHNPFVQSAGELFHVTTLCLAKRIAKLCDIRINRRCFAQIDP